MVAYFQSDGSFPWLREACVRTGDKESHILSEIWTGFCWDHLLYLAVQSLEGKQLLL